MMCGENYVNALCGALGRPVAVEPSPFATETKPPGCTVHGFTNAEWNCSLPAVAAAPVSYFPFGTVCDFSCPLGFTPATPALPTRRVCHLTQSWDEPQPYQCSPVACGAVSPPPHSTLTCTHRNGTSAGVVEPGGAFWGTFDDHCLQECNANAVALAGSPARTCSADGSWSGTPVYCKGEDARGGLLRSDVCVCVQWWAVVQSHSHHTPQWRATAKRALRGCPPPPLVTAVSTRALRALYRALWRRPSATAASMASGQAWALSVCHSSAGHQLASWRW